VTDRILAAGREVGLLLYPASKGIDGVRGDAFLIGPPLTITPGDLAIIVERATAAIGAVLPN
jgi:hypothetical protein